MENRDVAALNSKAYDASTKSVVEGQTPADLAEWQVPSLLMLTCSSQG